MGNEYFKFVLYLNRKFNHQKILFLNNLDEFSIPLHSIKFSCSSFINELLLLIFDAKRKLQQITFQLSIYVVLSVHEVTVSDLQ